MVFKNFRFGLILRVLTLVVTLVALNYVFYKTTWVVTPVMLVLVAISIIISLVRYVDKTNYLVSRFLSSLEFGDFMVKSNFNGSSSFRELVKAFGVISTGFQKISGEKEIQYHYLQSILDQVDTGIITYSEYGDVMLYNKSASEMLQVPYVQNISDLEKKQQDLYELIYKIQNGEKRTIQIQKGFQPLQLSVSKSVVKLKDKSINIISLNNISSAVNEAEIEAWQKLINVLTHEIMNSITPIVSLSAGMAALGDNNVSEDLKISLKTIESRGRGLMNFVDSYRTLTRIPEPKLQLIKAGELVNNVSGLLKKTMDDNDIDFEAIVKDENSELNIDTEQMEQVLINLILNAIEAVKSKEKKSIRLIVQNDPFGKSLIIVNDNGTGIDPELLDKVFVPFFTTKKNGSGIGLSLSKQIVKMHSGNIAVKSTPGEG